MKKMIMLLLLLPLVQAVEISEVYYNPSGTESGGEAVQLYNPENTSVEVTGWILSTETSSEDVTLPATSIAAQEYYLVTDTGWNESKDNPNWPDSDYEEAMTLGNSDAGVALVHNGTTIDAVGWGDASGIDDGLYMGTPASEVAEGESLLREQNTGDNVHDFVASSPVWQHVVAAATNTFQLTFSVGEYSVDISSVSLQEEVLPIPGDEVSVNVTAIVTHEVNHTLIGNVTMNNVTMAKGSVINTTSAEYSAFITVPYYAEPGNHTVRFAVASTVVNDTYEVLPLAAIALSDATIDINATERGVFHQYLGDMNMSSSLPTVKNNGNVLLDLGVKASALADGNSSFALENVQYSFDNDFTSAFSGSLSSSTQLVDINMQPQHTLPVGLEIFLPTDTKPGSYAGDIELSAVVSE